MPAPQQRAHPRPSTPTAFCEEDFADALKTPAVLRLLGVCELTLIRWRRGQNCARYGGGPPCLKVGRDFYYPRKQLVAWKAHRDAVDTAAKNRKSKVTRRVERFSEQLAAALQAQQP